MELKRYLFKDNRILDLNGKDKNHKEWLLEEIARGHRLSEDLVFSDEATDLIRKGDLIFVCNEIYQVKNDLGLFDTVSGYTYFVKDYINSIQAIYKLIGKDYICVWEKEV